MLTIFSIYDNQTAVYHQPFMVDHHQQALRYFVTLARDEKSDIHKFPSAFNLFELGHFDNTTGEITMLAHQVNHGFATAFLLEK